MRNLQVWKWVNSGQDLGPLDDEKEKPGKKEQRANQQVSLKTPHNSDANIHAFAPIWIFGCLICSG